MTTEERISVLMDFFQNNDLNDYWSEFQSVSFAIFDEEDVYLFNHPNYENNSQHPYVKLKRTNEFNGCTLILFEEIPTAIIDISYYDTNESLYSILVHELFHGHQYLNNESRFPNELLGVEYPTSAENIEIRNQERLALYNAIATNCFQEKELYTQQFVSLRKLRQQKFPDFIEYENLLETIEGPAFYVEYLAYKNINLHKDGDVLYNYINDLKDSNASIFNIRKSCYSSGLVSCLLLDIFSSSWKESLFNTSKTLFELLLECVQSVSLEPIKISDQSTQLSKEMIDRKQKEIEDFQFIDAVEVIIEGNIKVVGFDPINIIALQNKRLYKTFVKIKLNDEVLTINKPTLIEKKEKDYCRIQIKLSEKPLIQKNVVKLRNIGDILGNVVSESDKQIIINI
ncbi:hypothetical protein J6TS2_51790 [Heyndrickxia sporothermodurans]|nr:hypothetical protein J6TS2_51790 [Heyndrickxia sporothermodurans]